MTKVAKWQYIRDVDRFLVFNMRKVLLRSKFIVDPQFIQKDTPSPSFNRRPIYLLKVIYSGFSGEGALTCLGVSFEDGAKFDSLEKTL